jgi:NADH-quinone oxidoreductase subunit L
MYSDELTKMVVTQNIEPLLMLIPLCPLIGALLLYPITNGDKKLHYVSGWLATFFSLSAFLVTVVVSLRVVGLDALTFKGWTWFEVAPLKVEFALRFDKLSQIMTLVVTGVGTLIHLYSIGYMAEDEHRPRFFSYLNLFMFAMLLLVLGDNLLVMFVGWEGVGLCSYLLIGFWFKEMPNARAGQKAFVVNRIGDAGFLLGMFLLFTYTNTVNFLQLQGVIGSVPPGVLELVGVLLFIGAVGKSAQIPLYIWLPDAMAGPTPVSALIHAATMVTAGVYMVTRMSFLYELAPVALSVILVVGTLTAFVAATIALVQNDIKKVLAYSTVSQLGFMFMAIGAGAFSNGIFHVVTHAFFKACLFMAAGSVIMGCHHEQDMRHFGGLWKKMPATFLAYLVATLAIAGFPWTSGFYSKDAILWTVFSNKSLAGEILIAGYSLTKICWAIGAFTALLTAFYMTRSLVLTFFGNYRGHAEVHESPWVVTVPLGVLLVLSAAFGHFFGESLIHYLYNWTRADIAVGHEALAKIHDYHLLEQVSIVIAISGILLALLLYGRFTGVIEAMSRVFSKSHQFLSNKWYVDELYQLVIVGPLLTLSRILFSVFDRFFIDGTVNGSASVVEANGELIREMHNGRIGSYLMMMLGSLIFLIVFWLVL